MQRSPLTPQQSCFHPPSNLVLYGLEATGKSAITTALLSALSSQDRHKGTHDYDSYTDFKFAVVKSSECITGRHLLESTVGAIADAVEWKGKVGRCENLAQLAVEASRLTGGRHENSGKDSTYTTDRSRFVLVFDGVDHQRDAPPTLLPGLARLGEIVRARSRYLRPLSLLTAHRFQVLQSYSLSLLLAHTSFIHLRFLIYISQLTPNSRLSRSSLPTCHQYIPPLSTSHQTPRNRKKNLICGLDSSLLFGILSQNILGETLSLFAPCALVFGYHSRPSFETAHIHLKTSLDSSSPNDHFSKMSDYLSLSLLRTLIWRHRTQLWLRQGMTFKQNLTSELLPNFPLPLDSSL